MDDGLLGVVRALSEELYTVYIGSSVSVSKGPEDNGRYTHTRFSGLLHEVGSALCAQAMILNVAEEKEQ